MFDIPPPLVLGCNNPTDINPLKDYIQEQTGFEPDFQQSGFSDGCSPYGYGDEFARNNGGGCGDGYFSKYGYGDGAGSGYGEFLGGWDGTGCGMAPDYGFPNGGGIGYGDEKIILMNATNRHLIPQ